MAYAQKQIYTLVKYDEKVRKSPTNIQNVVYYNKYDTINQWRVDRQFSRSHWERWLFTWRKIKLDFY